MDALGWGVLATGRIARSFAEDLRTVPGARLAAVGSRSAASARAFAAEFGDGDCRAHPSYESLAEDPDVDVVYVASPHALHLEHARLALVAGKHVLCEKPLTLNTGEAEAMLALAREHDRFLMEAMWMTCHPVVRAVADGLARGRFGRPRQVQASIGFVVDAPPGDRLVDPALGAGVLLDMGVYCLTLADLVLGPAADLRATAGLDEAGVDLDLAGSYPDGAVAAFTATMTSAPPGTATIATDRGRIDLAPGFQHPSRAVWTPVDGAPETIAGVEPLLGSGLGNEAAEVGRCLRAGLRESPLVPLARTLRIMRQMDDLRGQIGVHYPTEA